MVDLNVYAYRVEKIRRYAFENGLSEQEVLETFENCFQVLERKKKKCGFMYFMKIVIITLFMTITGCIIVDRRFFAAVIMRNVQNSIYPGLKVLRRIAVPIIQRYPPLSEYYDEWCLLENPYFYVSDVDCWSCSIVRSVPDLTGYQISRSFNPGIPYTKSENLSEVNMRDLQELFWDNYEIFENDSAKVSSNNLTYKYIRNVMQSKMDSNPSEHLNQHVAWRINRMRPGRILRKLLPKPADTPNWWEQSIEKYLFLDEPKSPAYSLPNPECSNVVIRCTAGARLIKMIASPECSESCETSTILLSSGNTLWYNWWYWRPVSLPTPNTTGISVNYLTSFC